jgi:hypothetical protein
MTPFAWIPSIFIMLMLVQYYANFKFTVMVALMTGIYTDMHYQYIGPYVLVFTVTVMLIHWLQKFVSPRQYIASIVVLMGVASAMYVLSTFFISGLLNGFQSYFYDKTSVYQLCGIIGFAWAGSLVSIILTRSIVILYGYARR